MPPNLTRTTVAILVIVGSLSGCGSGKRSSSAPRPPSSSSSSSSGGVVSNPAPTLTSISPTTAIPGGTGFTLTVNGTNFTATSVLNWNGSPRGTTFVSASQLTAQIPSADIVG